MMSKNFCWTWSALMRRLEYGETELAWLGARDKKLGDFIAERGRIECELNDDLFGALVCFIATQQISNRAAETVLRRLHEKFEIISPEALLARADEIRGIGISDRKARYIEGLCCAALTGKIDLEGLRRMSDDEVASKLIPIKGIGPWTVEMFLIFSLGRMDVLSWGDFAIRRGMMRIHGFKDLDRLRFEEQRKLCSPYGTIASLYYWEASAL